MRWLLWIGIPLVTAMVAADHLADHHTRAPTGARDHRAGAGDHGIEPGRAGAGAGQSTTRSTSWRRRSTRCSPASTPIIGSNASSSPTRRTSCAARSLRAPSSSRWHWPDRTRSTGPTTAGAVLAEQQQLGRLIDDLLALGRLDEDGIGTVTDIDLDDVIVAEAARPRAVTVDIVRCEPVRVTGSPALMTRLVRNLLDNAAQHAAGRVRGVALRRCRRPRRRPARRPSRRRRRRSRCRRRTTGDRIFDRFIRLDEARGRDGGGGLGLADRQRGRQGARRIDPVRGGSHRRRPLHRGTAGGSHRPLS